MHTVYDHLLAAGLIAGLPLYATWGYPRLQRALAAGDAGARLHAYWETIALQWALAAAAVILWGLSGREWPDLGLGYDGDWRFWTGAAIVLVCCLLYVAQIAALRRDRVSLAKLKSESAQLAAIAPATEAEFRVFVLLSITAGICEELLYRGYLIWYLHQWVSLWAAVPLAAAIFGLGHAYQGRVGILKTGVVGLITGGLYVLMRSLFPVMLLHAIVDVCGGMILRLAMKLPPDEPVPAAANGLA